MARVIATASVRLEADTKGLSQSIRKEVRTALAEVAADANSGSSGTRRVFKQMEEDGERTAGRLDSVFSGLFRSLISGAGSLGSVLATATRFALLGAAVGGAVTSLSSFVGVLLPAIAAMAQAAGVAALLPAAFIAIQAATATTKLALVGMAEAFKALAEGDAVKLAEALKNLAPAAREFVLAAQGIKPSFDAMRLGVQQALFVGLADALKTLSAQYLPLTASMFVRIAGAMNAAGQRLAEFLTSGLAVGSVATLTQSLGATFDALAGTVTRVVSAFLQIASVGSTFLPAIAQGVTNLADRFNNFITQAAQSGALADFFQRSLDAAQLLGGALRDFGAAIGNVFEIADAQGSGFLNTLAALASNFRAFTESAQGQEALAGFFSAAATAAQVASPIIQELASVLGSTVAPVLQQLAGTIGPAVLGVVQSLAPAFAAAAPGIIALGQGVSALLTGITPVIPLIGQLAGVIASSLGQLLTGLAPVISQLATTLGQTLMQVLPPLIPPILQVVTALGGILNAVLPLLGPVGQLVTAILGPLGKVLQSLIGPIELVVNALIGALAPVIPVISEALDTLAQALAPVAEVLGMLLVQAIQVIAPLLPPLVMIISSLVKAIQPLLPGLLALVQPIIQVAGLLGGVLAGVISFLMSIITPLISLLSSGLGAAFSSFGSIVASVLSGVTGLVQGFVAFFTTAWTTVADIVSTVLGDISTFITEIFVGITTFITSSVNAILTTITTWTNSLYTRVRDAFNNVWQTVRDAFNSAVEAVRTGVNNVLQFVRDLPGNITSALGNLGELLVTAGKDVINGLISGLRAAGGAVKDFLVGLIGDAVDAVKSFLGIKSPSRVFMGIGRDMGKGMILGLENITPAAVAAARELATTVTDEMSGVGVMAASGLSADELARLTTPVVGAGAGGGVAYHLYQTNNMVPGADVVQFADRVAQTSARTLAAGGSVLAVSRRPVQRGVDDQRLNGVDL